MKVICFIVLILVTLSACNEDTQSIYMPAYSEHPVMTQGKEYIFGIHPLHNPKRLHEIFSPIADYLSRNIPGARFSIEASRNYAAFDKKLYDGKFHFSLPNPYQTVNALKHGYTVFGKMADDENFRGIILIRKDSEIKEVSELKGKPVSFPAPTALAATMMPQYFLQMNGLDVMKDIDIRYVGSQESSIMNVMYGDTVAGATWPAPWYALLKERPKLEDELKIMWQTDSLPNNALVVRDDVDREIIEQVKVLLFNLHKHDEGKNWLQKMELSQFDSATNETYRPVKQFLKRFHASVRDID